MKSILSSLLLSLLSAAAFAASTSSLPVISPDDYFERAQKKAEQLKLLFDENVRLEASGELDKTTLPEQLKEVQGAIAALQHDLKMASEGGHVVATYMLANMQSRFGMSKEERKQVCEPMHKAMEQGLLAAGVGYYYQCDMTYMRLDLLDPGHIRYLETLKQMLLKVDTNRDYYPLYTNRSLCFESDRLAETREERTLGNMQARASARMLTYDQYRADAYYILAATRVNDKGNPDSVNLTYLNQALALGCKDPMTLKEYYEKSFGNQASK
ncbi:hypothetical protein [Pseudomonas synxantha]|uniref:hypothetical protein n=1 Tax=Pseudomonas synxantha TaxID=47883 RepID=UPI000F5652C8|nr:hypothetical protein [Pseudomonas synxantha]AZE81101.1 hypothetical protein C4J99_5364 [Pseudomonas synxantha]